MNPEIHPWFRPVIPQIGESDPSIIGLFLTLDGQLHDYRAAVIKLRQARENRLVKQEALEVYQRTYAGQAAKMDDVTPWGEASQALRVATRNVERAALLATIDFASCHKTLDELEAALSAVIRAGKQTNLGVRPCRKPVRTDPRHPTTRLCPVTPSMRSGCRSNTGWRIMISCG